MNGEGTESAEKRVALVTGGSRGIGRAVVEALAAGGWTVDFCARDQARVEAAAADLAARFDDRVRGRVADVRREEEVAALVAWTLAGHGQLDLLVNNAGLGRFGPVDALSGDEFREVVETNLHGCFYAIRAVAPAMKARGNGWIVNVASLAGKNPFAGGAAYNASKFGLVGLSEAAMLDLRPHGVRVAAILPGSVATDFGAGRREGDSWMLGAEDVARAVVDLVAYPERALPSLLELRPTRPPARG
ncbi:MAG TPA: SDR family oxidoreductase [Thermoanaerobaculia bacterium]|nr:SDR family oxidoreductase [Thermoanaerobaculia bacterium]